ncbi:hypothetical protein E4T66_10510 [Sinimarinibacterium sp. CAU 1509]|uniref:hypothetical protein n=1 Tax=Sinimarinibacterium sp. CAU 1509 TaxID=2562283 RepID=UPI0010AC72DA|nr:hypothetical protein [Sinimarinibacterium sp. CAU 1509]TJY61057.1 hypothetical protein E4T66_10510 [Sinimarinibacterium sp. CAU 1509]
MGVEIKLTDRELPVSPVFIDYLAHLIDGRPFQDHEWHDQLSEQLNFAQRNITERAPKDAERVINDPRGRAAIGHAYQWLLHLFGGNLAALREIQLRYHFVNVIGIPRCGGSYLTKELYRALGYDPTHVPNALAHDGFPEAGPFELSQGRNSWILSLQTMAEYLTMVEMFFQNAARHSGKVVVPKKLTKGIYAGGFFHRVLGEAVDMILTVRHPVTACVSTYEKSGGLPANERFAVRSNIEEWCRRDLAHTGTTAQQFAEMDYFDAYLRYWEQYHINIATTGLSASRDLRIIAYGRQRMEDLAASFHRRYDSSTAPTEFKASDEPGRRHPQWVERAQPVIHRVADLWQRVGLEFPVDQVMELQ